MSELNKSNVTQSGKGFLVAGILAAVGASICCVGPLVSLALGVSGAWIGSLTALEPYRPFFIGLTLLFLAFAFHRLYFARRVCTPRSACANPYPMRKPARPWIFEKVRSTMTFGRANYPWVEDEYTVPIEETLTVLGDLVKAGKIRYVGVSNETPWGVAQFLNAADKLGLPRIVSIQNPYSLVNRTFETGLSEFTHKEGIGLLAYSPMAFGWLSGKYEGGARPDGARITLFERFQRYSKPHAIKAISAYVELAKRHGPSPAQLALAFVNSRPFTTSTLIGATSLAQLHENIGSVDVKLSDEILAEINALHEAQPNPAP